MLFHGLGTALVTAFIAWLTTASALACTNELEDFVGYTIIASTQVDGEFEGCDFDKTIRLTNGSRYRCSEYSYTYAYSPDVIVFAKPMVIGGKNIVTIKLLIDDDTYDMYPVIRSEKGK